MTGIRWSSDGCAMMMTMNIRRTRMRRKMRNKRTIQYYGEGLCTKLQHVHAISIGYQAFTGPNAITASARFSKVRGSRAAVAAIRIRYGLCAFYEIVPPEDLICLGC